MYQLLSGGTDVFVGPIRQVDDRAASQFAETLYTALLRGDELGDAILEARCRAPMVAASYHCYGALDWRLVFDTGIATS